MPEVTYVGLPVMEARAMEALASGVSKAAHDLEGRAKGVTPVDTGTLKGSIEAHDPVAVGFTVTARVATGGESSAYAVYVHEGHFAVHGAPAGGIGPRNATYVPPVKYLERPLIEMAGVYEAFIAAAARSAF
jgi:hypothetical protein